jgi:hypothetical protein
VTRALGRALISAAVLAVALGGCTIGPDEQGPGTTRLTVSRDFGERIVVEASRSSLPGGETVMRFLQREAKVETRYGGRFVQAIDGTRSTSSGGRRKDWFYYVNGIEEDVGAADKELHSGDHVWWDYHDWGTAMRVPAVVGAFPEPFAHGAEGKRFPIRVDCAQSAADTCNRVVDRLDKEGVSASTTALGAPAGKELLRFVVGPWDEVRKDSATRLLEEEPSKSGVFMRVRRLPGRTAVELLDQKGAVSKTLGGQGGFIAATRFEEQQPTWTVSGTTEAGVERAVQLLREEVLRDHFAVATDDTRSFGLPLARGAQGEPLPGETR